MKTIKANNYSQAIKEVEALDKELSLKVKEEIKYSDRKHNHVVAIKISDRPGEAKNEVTANTIIVNDDKLAKLKRNFKFLGFAKIIVLHDATQIEVDETPVLHLHDKQSIEAKVKADLESKHKAEMDELRKKYEQDALEDKSNTNDDNDDVLVKYADELDATVGQLKEYANDNDIDLTGLKNKEDIQLAIGTWLSDQENGE